MGLWEPRSSPAQGHLDGGRAPRRPGPREGSVGGPKTLTRSFRCTHVGDKAQGSPGVSLCRGVELSSTGRAVRGSRAQRILPRAKPVQHAQDEIFLPGPRQLRQRVSGPLCSVPTAGGRGRGPEKSFQPQGRLWGESWRRSFPAVGPRRVPWCFYTSVGRSRGGECRHMHARVWEPHCTPMYTLHTCNSDVTAPSARPGLSLLSKSEHVTAQRSPATSGLRVPR